MTTPLLALTLHQPWATLILRYGKDVENRPWKPPPGLVGARLVIHAGRRWDAAGWHTAVEMYGAHLPAPALDPGRYPGRYPAGAILGTVALTGYHHSAACHRPGPAGNLAVGVYTCSRWATGSNGGQVHWMLADPHMLPEPLPYPGARRLWPVPAEIANHLNLASGGDGDVR